MRNEHLSREIDVLDGALAAAGDASGRVVLLEGPAGSGKTRLLDEIARRARKRGFRVLHARGNELERGFSFGTAIGLLERCWTTADSDERERLQRGPARLAGILLEEGLHNLPSEPTDEAYSVIRACYAFARNLAGRAPLALVIDDAHAADRPSLRFLAYLAERIAQEPIVLVSAVGVGEKPSDAAALTAVRHLSATRRLELCPLSRRKVEELVRAEFPDTDAEFVAACFRATLGNPFLLTELLSQVRADGRAPDAMTAVGLADTAPEAIVEWFAARLERMGSSERALARALAVLGDGAALKVAARVAELELREASDAADSLSARQVLDPGQPLSFVHPLSEPAILASMAPLSRDQTHTRAAITLREAGAPSEAIAGHALEALPGEDPNVVGALREVAQEKLRSGDAQSAARLLVRALDERPPADLEPEIVAELGQAEARLGAPQAPERLDQAIRAATNPRRRAELALAQGQLLLSQKRPEDAVGTLNAGLRELNGNDRQLALELEAAYIAAASLVPGLEADALARRAQMLSQIDGPPTAQQRSALAYTVILDALKGQSRRDVRELADLAWGEGSLLDAAGASDGPLASLTGALLFVDELERDLKLSKQILAGSQEEYAVGRQATVSYLRAWPRYEQGDIDGAEADAKEALDAPDHCQWTGRAAYGALACCRALRGQFDKAETALALIGDERIASTLSHPFLLEVRARLRLAQHRPLEALEDSLRAGDALESGFGVTNPGAVAWRSTAALAEIALGHPERAQELAATELERAERIGVTRVVIRDLRVLGVAVGGSAGIALLEKAVETAEHASPRLEGTLALVELGTALRRARRRGAAREPLRKALELSHRGGATVVTKRARMELIAAGARPRRMMLSGLDSLTPGERRVADLVAPEMTTRKIAETLFITPKTVEYHLRHIYQKLNVRSRAELAAVLSGRST